MEDTWTSRSRSGSGEEPSWPTALNSWRDRVFDLGGTELSETGTVTESTTEDEFDVTGNWTKRRQTSKDAGRVSWHDLLP